MVQVAVAGNVTEAEELQSILLAAGIDSTFEMAAEHQPDALDDPPLNPPPTPTSTPPGRSKRLTEPDELYDE